MQLCTRGGDGLKESVRRLTFAAVTAAAYVCLALAAAPISFGPLQLRIAEALCILPFFIPCAGWGLFAGCIIANLIGGAGIPDVVFGSAATLAAAFATSAIKSRPLACLPPAVINGIVVGAVLARLYSPDAFLQAFLLYSAQVFAGEALVLYALGLPLMYVLPKIKAFTQLQKSLGRAKEKK